MKYLALQHLPLYTVWTVNSLRAASLCLSEPVTAFDGILNLEIVCVGQ